MPSTTSNLADPTTSYPSVPNCIVLEGIYLNAIYLGCCEVSLLGRVLVENVVQGIVDLSLVVLGVDAVAEKGFCDTKNLGRTVENGFQDGVYPVVLDMDTTYERIAAKEDQKTSNVQIVLEVMVRIQKAVYKIISINGGKQLNR